MNIVDGVLTQPQTALSADDISILRDALLVGLDALGELQRLGAAGIEYLNPDPDGVALGQIVASLRIIQ